ncbi:MAG: LacI family DNA-binding transcriptional regulator [Thomasclavelia sp.]|jgi:LacI family sucrose operon transcriptional repressor|nr:LacI family DNA-binding transcriptional regulator [Thomasclavelia sp.]
MATEKITIKDIAKMAGVSKSTVSRYFNDGYVKEDTKEKIKKIIDEYNYQPNAFAQSLKAKRSNLIGVIAPTLISTTSSRMLMSIDKYLKDKGYRTIFINTDHDEKEELRSMENLWRMKVDGIILLATKITMTHQTLVDKMDIPFLFVAQEEKLEHSIINDDYNAGKDIGRLVGSKGHKDIMYLGVSRQDYAVGVLRKKGIVDGLKETGVKKITSLETDFSTETTREVAKDMIKRYKFDMVICATDTIALATYKELIDAGYKIPEEVSLCGFGGYDVSQLIDPSLCTIRFENEKAGEVAGETIIKLINEEEVPLLQVIGYKLINGESIKEIS